MNSTVTIIMDDYANGAINKDTLVERLKQQGFNQQVMTVLVKRADIRKRKAEIERAKAVVEGYEEKEGIG